jgi:hypothetical protein
VYLTRDVGVTDDETVLVEPRRSAVVGRLGVGEEAELHVGDKDVDVEGGVRGDILVVFRECDQ